jgi:uncharacterized protein
VSADLAVLYHVQQLDTELARLRAELAALLTGDELTAEIAAAEAERTDLLARHHKSEAEAAAVELETKTLQEKKAKFDAQLYGGTVRNPRQLEDLQNEVGMLAREISKLDDRMLELMEAIEDERAELREREVDLTVKRDRLGSVVANLEADSTRLKAAIAELEAQRKARAAEVDPPLLKRYDQIRVRQGNLGLVKVTDSTCPGCRVSLASELLRALRLGRSGLTCDSCGRLLYIEQSED